MEPKRSGWAWVPSLYVFQGIPSHLVTTTSVLIFTVMGVDAASITFWIGLASLPWSFKPLWAPIVERKGTLRQWVLTTEGALGLAMLGLALGLMSESFFAIGLVLMTLIAFLSATHDIACDGYYMNALDVREQSFFVGIRSTFYRVAMIAAGGLLPILAEWAGGLKLPSISTPTATGWAMGIGVVAALLMILWAVNRLAMPKVQEHHGRQDDSLKILGRALKSFFTHPGAVAFIAFFLTYRLGEAQLAKIVPIFMLGDKASGGLEMSATEYGVAYGTAGVVALTLGGILGGIVTSRYGLKKALWPMILMMNLPNLAYVALAHYSMDVSKVAIYATVIIEQFGYGFGFTAYMLSILAYVRESEYKAAEYSIGTSLMTLGIILPGLPAGKLSEQMGYEAFFIMACVATIPGMICAAFLRIPEKD